MSDERANIEDGFNANAQGRITPEQRELLLQRYDRTTAAIVGGWLAFLVVVMGLTMLWLSLNHSGSIFDGRFDDELTAGFAFGFIGGMLFSVWVMAVVKNRYTVPTVERLMASSHVRQSRASIEWHQGGFKARIDGRWYPTIHGKAGIRPGIYSVHHIDNPNWMLSARPLETTHQSDHDDALLRSLARANGFVAAALPLNRAGWLGLWQRVKLLPRISNKGLNVLGGCIAIVFSVGFVGVFGMIMLQLAAFEATVEGGTVSAFGIALPTLDMFRNDPGELLPFAMFFIIVVLVVFSAFRTLARIFSIMLTILILLIGRLHQVDGELSRYEHVIIGRGDNEGEEYRSYYYVMRGRHFLVPKRAYDALPESVQARAYYVPRRIRSTGSPTLDHYLLVNVDVL